MPEYWAVGWKRFCDEGGIKEDWRFTCGPIEWEEPPKLNTLIKVMEPYSRDWAEYLLTGILGESLESFLTALTNLNDETESDLYEILDEVARVAYEAGRNGVVPPDSA